MDPAVIVLCSASFSLIWERQSVDRRAHVSVVRISYPTQATSSLVSRRLNVCKKGNSHGRSSACLYPHPKNAAEFDRAYREEHLPYAGPRLNGATGVVTKKVVGPAFAPPPYHLISDVSFPTIDAMKACAGSAEGKEALAHAASISTGGAPTIVAVVDDI